MSSIPRVAVILAGGLGTRLSEETDTRPKPMIEIGGYPLLWHIMKYYLSYGVQDFVICLGYKGYIIKEYFTNYYLHMSDVTFDLRKNQTEIHRKGVEPWRVTLVDTGHDTMTGGRLKRVREYIGEETFCLTYGDGLTDLDLGRLCAFHDAHGGAATVTAVRPPGRFGALDLDGVRVRGFREKPEGDDGWINGGFFVLEPRVIDRIVGDDTVWEREPLQGLAEGGDLHAFKHDGFWQPVDTLRDKRMVETLWRDGRAPWRRW